MQGCMTCHVAPRLAGRSMTCHVALLQVNVTATPSVGVDVALMAYEDGVYVKSIEGPSYIGKHSAQSTSWVSSPS